MFYLVKLKVTFRNTIFWCWIWPLIHTNYFYNLELIEIKAYSAPTCISINFNVNNLQIWTNLLKRKRKSLFHWKNPCLPNQCCFQRFELMETKMTLIANVFNFFRLFVCKVLWEKGKIFQWIIWVFLFIETILMTLIFLMLMSDVSWNNTWCR